MKNFPHKAEAICGEKKKAYLNSNLASNIILTANFQSIRVVLTNGRSGQANSTCIKKVNSLECLQIEEVDQQGENQYGTLE